MMPNQKGKQWVNIAVALTGTILVTVLLAFFFDSYYDINDDVLMKDILSGVYLGEPSAYNIQMLYPLSAALAGLYSLAPHLPWYGLFLQACHVLCCYLLLVRLCKMADRVWKKLVLTVFWIGLIISVLLWQLIYVQYTVTSGLLMATAAFWFYTTDSELSVKQFIGKNIVSLVLMVLAFCLRSEMGLLLLPLFAVLGIMKWYDAASIMEKSIKVIDGKKRSHVSRFFSQENLLKYLTLICTAGVMFLMAYFGNKLAYGSKGWTEFTTLFDSRTEVYDFLGLPQDYETSAEVLETVGISKAQHELLLNYNYIFDEQINADLLERLEIILGDDGNRYYKKGLWESLREYIYRASHMEDAPFVYLVWVCYGCLIITSVMIKNRTYLWKIPLLIATRSALWVFLISRGRMPARITVPLLIMEFVVLLALLVVEIAKLKDKERWLYRRFWAATVMAFIGLIGIGSARTLIYEVNDEQTRREEENAEWQAMQEYCKEHSDNLYLLDIYSTVEYSEMMFKGVDNSLANYTYAGGWACKSPIEEEKLALFGIENVEKDYLLGKNIFFIAKADSDVRWISDYYASKGTKAAPVRIDTIPFSEEGAFVVYRLLNLEP